MRRVISRKEAVELLASSGTISFNKKRVGLAEAFGKRAGEPLKAPFDLPQLSRSTRDGYAVNHLDVKGVSEALPAFLNVVGEVKIGEIPSFSISLGEAARVFTGSYLPNGADAVVMDEFVEESSGVIEVYRSVAAGENVISAGEDCLQGSTILNFGEKISVGKLGLLAAYGFDSVNILDVKVGIVSTGDEIVSPGSQLSSGKIYDINSFTLYALLKKWGANPYIHTPVPDDLEMLKKVLEELLDNSDVIIFSGGSSVGTRDHTKELFKLFNGKLIIEGINISPGKPTLAGWVKDKLVFGLPGHPVSSVVSARVFLIPVIERILGIDGEPVLYLPVLSNLPSKLGVEEFVCASVNEKGVFPILGKSGAISRIANGGFLIKIPDGVEGYKEGEVVETWSI